MCVPPYVCFCEYYNYVSLHMHMVYLHGYIHVALCMYVFVYIMCGTHM